jgi:DNA-binding MarR family transcriptional regulator
VTVTAGADLEQLLSTVAYRLTRRLTALLEGQGSTLEEWRVLSLLSVDDGQSMSRIAAYGMLAAPTLTKVIDRMVDANLVYRRGDEKDRRRVLVHLAPRGRTLFAGLSARVERDRVERDAALSTAVDPVVLTALLGDVLAALE